MEGTAQTYKAVNVIDNSYFSIATRGIAAQFLGKAPRLEVDRGVLFLALTCDPFAFPFDMSYVETHADEQSL